MSCGSHFPDFARSSRRRRELRLKAIQDLQLEAASLIQAGNEGRVRDESGKAHHHG